MTVDAAFVGEPKVSVGQQGPQCGRNTRSKNKKKRD